MKYVFLVIFRCESGWQGPGCDKCSTKPGCLHGTCDNPLDCNCDEGWTGENCDQRMLRMFNFLYIIFMLELWLSNLFTIKINDHFVFFIFLPQ